MKPSRNCGAMAIAAALFTVLANSNGAAVASGPATATP
ncbi:MAG: hypothetical protein QOJ32_3302, partial [Frankiaceae bacterium]|nr:hypothetical protein [Frankiaceae bacterium]